jgi:hypothetical protein
MKVYINTAEICITGKGWVKPYYYENGDRITMEALTYWDIEPNGHFRTAAGTEDFSPERIETLESAVLIYTDTRTGEVINWKFFRYNKGNEAVREVYAKCMETSLRAGGVSFVEVEVKDWRDFI